MLILKLLFDFDTSGIGDFKRQKALQLAWQLCDSGMQTLETHSYYFNDITEWNTDFHKDITVEFIKKNGQNPKLILNLFITHCCIIFSNEGQLIAHNVSFDFQILKNEYKRNQLEINHFQNFTHEFQLKDLKNILYCTMINTINLCGIPKTHGGGNKFPKLSELYSFLYKKEPDLKLHEASNDVEILKRCCCKLFGK